MNIFALLPLHCIFCMHAENIFRDKTSFVYWSLHPLHTSRWRQWVVLLLKIFPFFITMIVNLLRPEQNSRYFAGDIFESIL